MSNGTSRRLVAAPVEVCGVPTTGAMPIYEYRCNACGRVVSVFQRSIHAPAPSGTRCTHCGADDLTRLMSRFTFHRSTADLDAADDDALLEGVDENDPRSVARWARRMSEQLGEDLGPEFDEMLDRMAAGEMPEEDEGDEGDEDLDSGDDEV
ncbi:MAG: hypothetical protein C4290_01165 [Chloroflexota bacterium]